MRNETNVSAYGTSVMIEISKENQKRDQKMSINKFQKSNKILERGRGWGWPPNKKKKSGNIHSKRSEIVFSVTSFPFFLSFFSFPGGKRERRQQGQWRGEEGGIDTRLNKQGDKTYIYTGGGGESRETDKR